MGFNLGSFAKKIVDKGSTYLSTKAREGVLKAARAKLDREAVAEYNSRFLGNLIRADVSIVSQDLHRFAQEELYAWQALPNWISADGKTGRFPYALTLTETFFLGQLRSPIEALTVSMNIKLGDLAHRGQTEAMPVPYRMTFTVELKAIEQATYATAVLHEEVDPQGSVTYIRNGHVRVPSLIGVRTGNVSIERMLERFHRLDAGNRPDLPAWFASEGQHLPHLAKLLAAHNEAEAELERVKARRGSDAK